MRLLGAMLVAVVPGQALAEVCDKVAPDWNPANGPVSLVGGTLYYLGLFPSIVIGAAFAISLWLRYRRCWLITLSLTVLWLGVQWITWTDTTSGSTGLIMRAAVREGCVNAPYLYFALLFGLLVYSAYGLMRGRKPQANNGVH